MGGNIFYIIGVIVVGQSGCWGRHAGIVEAEGQESSSACFWPLYFTGFCADAETTTPHVSELWDVQFSSDIL